MLVIFLFIHVVKITHIIIVHLIHIHHVNNIA